MKIEESEFHESRCLISNRTLTVCAFIFVLLLTIRFAFLATHKLSC